VYFRGFVGKDTTGTDDPKYYDEAVSKGYVATHADGSPYVFTSNFNADAAMIDFTNPAAVAWWQGRIRAALAAGADGFMQDFGEQVFDDMHFHDGSTGAQMHNRFPVLFHRATAQSVAVRAPVRHPADAAAVAAVPGRRARGGARPGVDAGAFRAGGTRRDGGRDLALRVLPARLLARGGRAGPRAAVADGRGGARPA